jgi:TonB family protein
MQGEVVIAAIVACDGTLKDVTVLKASHPELRSPAVDNVSTWRYKPGLVDGQVRPTIVSFIVSFKLR